MTTDKDACAARVSRVLKKISRPEGFGLWSHGRVSVQVQE